ncbi:hypothetical protein DFJ77DRAFT_472969 [Powellomyces hirtus]|nr:hypothetical protein DFJ77DRAFT_472969 [Powellomyces hirtus]
MFLLGLHLWRIDIILLTGQDASNWRTQIDQLQSFHPGSKFSLLTMTSSAEAPTVTAQLLTRNADAYSLATHHAFLSKVAHSTADRAFERWLTQDFHFVVAYLKFLSTVLARVPTHVATSAAAEPLVKGFVDAIESIAQEARFFRDRAATMNIELTYTAESMTPTTQTYLAFLDTVAREGTWAETLVALWAVEKVYLDSWTFAAEAMPLNRPNKYDRFIRHWANAEFARFVTWLETIANDATGPLLAPGVEKVFQTVVHLEIAFWDAALQGHGEAQ